MKTTTILALQDELITLGDKLVHGIKTGRTLSPAYLAWQAEFDMIDLLIHRQLHPGHHDLTDAEVRLELRDD